MKTLSRKRITLVVTLAIIIGLLISMQCAYAETASGECGLNARWELDDSGKLTITGKGDMYRYDSERTPWYSYAFRIKSIEVGDGITSIGDGAFKGLLKAQEVKLADTVRIIRGSAFANCEVLAKIDVPSSVQTIEEMAFSDCVGLKTIIIRKGTKRIEEGVIANSPNIETVHYTGTKQDWDSEVISDTNFGKLIEYNHGEKWGAFNVTKEATCSADGKKERSCSVCGDTESETIARNASAHNYVTMQTVAPTISSKGKQSSKCSYCGASKTTSIPKLKAKVLRAKATSIKPNSATIKWNSVPGAARYMVYYGPCGKQKPKLIKIVKADTTSYDVKIANPQSTYKFNIVAQKKINGKWERISTTRMGHFVTDENPFYTNPKALEINKSSAAIKEGKTYKIKANVLKKNTSKSFIPKDHGAEIRYVSSDKSVAKVDEKGKVKAVKKGTCNIYVFAINGSSKCVKIRVY